MTTRITILDEPGHATSVADLMKPAAAVLPSGIRVLDAIERLRTIAHSYAFTYAYVLEGKRLVGVLVMRELLFAAREVPIDSIMIGNPFWLGPELSLAEAMRLTLNKHFPVYPVCDADGTLMGTIRGDELFRAQAVEISAQMGSSLGVSGEGSGSSLWQGLKARHGWLQINLFTAFAAGAVVGLFEDTIAAVVVLSAFLPVLAGQSGNTGCQSLAVVLRGLTLGEIKPGTTWRLLGRETLLGLINGLLVGVVAGAAMWWYASSTSGGQSPLSLALTVLLAMAASCASSGFSGAAVPLLLRRFGFDPATAASIFVTTSTDIASLGLFLGLARLLVL
jgi:magnesium transporter